MRSQISLEYLILVGLLLAVLSPIFYYAFSTSVETVKMDQASNLVKKIVNTADTLYALGPNSQDTIEITVPGGVENITIKNKEVSLAIKLFRGISYVIMDTKTNISGNISIKSGAYHITLKNENNTIKVAS